jgi:hypothetical protein
MATIEQIRDFSRFAEQLPAEEREGLSMDELYNRWRAEVLQQEDVEAIRESLEDYERGERGRPAAEIPLAVARSPGPCK